VEKSGPFAEKRGSHGNYFAYFFPFFPFFGILHIATHCLSTATGDLVIATPAGQKLASPPNQRRLETFAIAPRPGQSGLLVTLNHGLLQAFTLQP
jgi:hypothetical protein